MKILLKLAEGAKMPKNMREGDCAFDLAASESVLLKANTQQMVPTGVHMAIPKGFAGLIWDRSGLAAKSKLTTMAGVIDSNYRGEIKVVLRNLGDEDFHIEMGDRIAQMLIQKAEQVVFEESEELDETNRGHGSFGSTGVK